jgi:membrane fusion protein (multidrug efflux system)
VFVVKDGLAKRRVVTTGYANNGSLEIVSGLTEGEMVVTVGQTSLKDGAKVAVIGAKPTATKVAAKDSAKTKG